MPTQPAARTEARTEARTDAGPSAGPDAWLATQLRALHPRWALLSVLALIAVVYAPTLRFALVYDDGWVLITNGFLREPDLSLLFSPRGAALHVPDVFRPTSVLFDLLSYRLVGLNATAHHALSMALHLGVCALGYAFARRVGVSQLRALAACALFGVMGIHAEVVALVSYREDMLALGFGLAAMIAASDALSRSGTRVFAPTFAALLLMALAAGAKLSVALLPLFWLAIERTRSKAPGARRHAFVFAAMVIGVGLALWQRQLVLGGLDPYNAASNWRVLAARPGVPFGEIIAASTQIQLSYLAQSLLPLGLSPEYSDHHLSWSSPSVVLSLVSWAAVIALSLVAWMRGPKLVALCVLGFALLALPTANLVGMPNMRADRFAYASSLPLALLFASAALTLGSKLAQRVPSTPWLSLAPLVVLLLVQGSLAIAASSAFVSNRSLWAVAAERAPDSARARAMFGLMRLSTAGRRLQGDARLAATIERDCARAERLDPHDELAQICHARLAAALGKWPEAKSRFLRATELAPDHEGAWLASLAQATLESARPENRPGLGKGRSSTPKPDPQALERARAEAERILGQAGRDYPYLAEVHLVAARLAQRAGDPARARTELGRARSLRPERWETVLALIELELDLGQVAGAYAIWRQEAMVLAGADPIARDHLLRRIRDAQKLGLSPDPQPSL